MPQTEVTTTSATDVSTTTTPPTPRPTTTKPTIEHTSTPVRRRLVITSRPRGSIEQRTGRSFPGVWAEIQNDLQSACPAKKPCVGYALVVDPSGDLEGDCRIVAKGVSVPDPLYEGGKVRFRVNNKNRGSTTRTAAPGG